MKKSFFERLTGSSNDEMDEERDMDINKGVIDKENNGNDWMEENNDEGQLTVDVFQTTDDIIIKAMVAGVKPDDLDVSITQDMITIRGKREERHKVERENYFYRELYWGTFSRSILLPQEIDPDEAEAAIKN
ncbi:MAG TPA: Hsp20/alpha crystallin family protein, partial [Candidatus Campbellbacteria bacterium]|nr:Hsp20/alpha crystallin family protein [Candidatus Campbellbacteria bacterium]